MKFTTKQLRDLIAEEIDEMKMSPDTSGKGERYREWPNITGPSPEYGGYEEEEEESPCAMAAEEPPDLETRMDSIEGKLIKMSTHLDMIMQQLQISEEKKKKKDDDWIDDAEKDIERRGTKGVCTGKNFGSDKCPPGSKRYNLAKTFRKMAKDKKK